MGTRHVGELAKMGCEACRSDSLAVPEDQFQRVDAHDWRSAYERFHSCRTLRRVGWIGLAELP